MNVNELASSLTLLISYRGKKIEIPLHQDTSVSGVKSEIVSTVDETSNLQPNDIKLIHKGKVLLNEEDTGTTLYDKLTLTSSLSSSSAGGKKKKKVIRLMATGVSSSEARVQNEEFELGKRNAPRIKDDLSDIGRRELIARQRLGQMTMSKVSKRMDASSSSRKYGFGRIETLPMLPDQEKAKEILNSLARDPGILACMATHQWNVGCLAEMYPEGKVGESEVCIMGLNQNKGQKILLRIRTDDLKGFRKPLSIRKVLFHELAHNVHSDHDEKFFQLMRQVEKECNEMDWTNGAGLQGMGLDDAGAGAGAGTFYEGGTYRLGGGKTRTGVENENEHEIATPRELAARAALMRLSAEEQAIEDGCGCGMVVEQHSNNRSSTIASESRTTSKLLKDREDDKNMED